MLERCPAVVEMTLYPDESDFRRLELHEARAHGMRPGRHVRELPDGVVLHDDVDADPFWNRIAAVRFPSDDRAFARRLDELVVYFAGLGRRAHLWASPGYHRPDDLERRLALAGFVDLGRGLLMALANPDRARSVTRRWRRDDVTVERLAGADGQPGAGLAGDVGLVAGEAFDVPTAERPGVVHDFLTLLGRPGFCVYLVRVGGEPAALAKATTFDGATYLSTIGTRPAYRGRGLAALATATACVDAVEARSEWTYLGVFEANLAARRLYERLGFEDVGEPGGDWLL